MKATDEQIVASIKKLEVKTKVRGYEQYGDENAIPLEFQREDIQEQVKDDYGIEYSDSGFRNRLKKMVSEGKVGKWRAFPYTVFYRLK